MNYAENILKHDAYYYSLNRATISDGVLTLNTRGSATCTINTSDLPYLTSTFMFSCIAEPYNNRYKPTFKAIVRVKIADSNDWYTIELYPINDINDHYICIFNIPDGEYSDFTFTLYSSTRCTVTLWELCPEALSENIEVIIDGVKQSLPRLLYDYNTFDFTADVHETTIAIITCRLLDNTDLQGHFTTTFTASEACTVVVRFYDNNSEELFSPLYYDVYIGYNTISIPHAFLKRKAGLHTFIVSIQAFAGELTFYTRGILFTIDGGYLAARELDVGINVLDIAIRQPLYVTGPDEIWLVGLDAGELLVRKRSYTDTNVNVAFTHVASMGKAIGGAIEFNGDWVYRRGTGRYTIETEEEAYIFIIREDNTLLAYHGVHDENPYVIDTDVTLVKACRGYSSMDYIEFDQGLVAAYIRSDGAAWYCQYCYDTILHTYAWQIPVLLDNGPWDFINVTRLNDYRLSFQLTNEEHNVWLYTERTYVAQSVAPEEFDASFRYFEYSMYCGPTPTVEFYDITYTNEQQDNLYVLTIHYYLNHPLLYRDTDELNLNNFITLSGTTVGYNHTLTYDPTLVCIDVIFKTGRDLFTLPITSCNVTLNSNVYLGANINEQYYTFGTITGEFSVDNTRRISQNVNEEFNATFDFSNTEFTYLTKSYYNGHEQEEFTLGSYNTQLSKFKYQGKNYYYSFNEESFALATKYTIGFTYENVHVKPV